MLLGLIPQIVFKKFFKAYNIVTRRPRVVGLSALSAENAKAIYGHRTDIQIHSFVKGDCPAFVPPKHLPEDRTFRSANFGFPKEPPKYDSVLLDIRNPNFTFQHNHLIDDDRRVIYEPKITYNQLSIRHKFLTDSKKIEGTVAYFSNTLFCQYGHWLQTQLPMLLSYWETFGKENIDYYYIGEGPIKDFVQESFNYLGIQTDQIINYPCRADRSLISIKFRDYDYTAMRSGLQMDMHSHRFLQKMLFKPQPPSQESLYPKKIFVMRGQVKVRKELNIREIRDALEPLGFSFITMDGKTMQDEANIFGHADVIVGVHGSALHNTLFSRPGTKVIELFSYDYFEPSNYIIANNSGCDYYYLIGEPTLKSKADLSFHQRNYTDVLVNIEKLMKICSMANLTGENLLKT